MKKSILLIIISLAGYWGHTQGNILNFKPKHYMCYRPSGPITIDGKMDEDSWEKAVWTDYFVDIEGTNRPTPRFSTRVKMLWDDQFFYVAAELEEPHVWATLTERESVIFYDPDFEVFIDPDGDTHQYLEYEMNALNTQWDLQLVKPYRDDLVHNVAIDHWNYNGIRSAVHVEGTLNDPTNQDQGWTLEIAFPLDALAEVSATGKNAMEGEQYRVNFSRVEWNIDIAGGKYSRKQHMVDGVMKPMPEDNWVWSPQGVIAMHQPETWGIVQFSGKAAGGETQEFRSDPDHELVLAMRLLYYRQMEWKKKTGKFSGDLASLGFGNMKVMDMEFQPDILLSFDGYQARVVSADKKHYLFISQDGKNWKEQIK